MTAGRRYASSLIILAGMMGAWTSTQYKLGTLANMGPGYYPLMLSILLVILGVLIAVVPDLPEDSDEPPPPLKTYIRPWSGVLGGAMSFVILGRYGGLVPATFVLVFLAALGDKENSVRDSMLLAVGAVVFTVIVFHYAMQIQFPLWQWG